MAILILLYLFSLSYIVHIFQILQIQMNSRSDRGSTLTSNFKGNMYQVQEDIDTGFLGSLPKSVQSLIF